MVEDFGPRHGLAYTNQLLMDRHMSDIVAVSERAFLDDGVLRDRLSGTFNQSVMDAI